MQCRIRVKGHLDLSWQPWFAPLQLSHETSGITVLSGLLPDQAALFGILLKIQRLGITLFVLVTFVAYTRWKVAPIRARSRA